MDTYFAKINEHGIVDRVIIADQTVVNDMEGTWVETFIDHPSKKYAAVGDGFDGSNFMTQPFHTSNWDAETKEWITPAELGIVNDASPIIAADGVEFVTVYIAGAAANSSQEIRVNDEPFSIDINAGGYGEFELSSDTPGLLLVEWNGFSLEVAAL